MIFALTLSNVEQPEYTRIPFVQNNEKLVAIYVGRSRSHRICCHIGTDHIYWNLIRAAENRRQAKKAQTKSRLVCWSAQYLTRLPAP
jgi:hypothetical protein